MSEPFRETHVPPCRICTEPLSAGELNLNQTWHYHCQICQICSQELPAPERIAYCLDQNIPVSHLVCYQQEKIRELKTQTIPVSREHIQILNDKILGLRQQYIPAESDLQLLLETLNDLKECAANVSSMLQLTRERIHIKNNESDVQHEKKQKAAKAEVAATLQVKVEKAAQLAAERSDPKLRERRKAIEGIMKTFGFSEEQAIAMLSATATPTN
jgi:hypothetical protein